MRLDSPLSQQERILELVEDVKALRVQIEDRDKRLTELESRLADLQRIQIEEGDEHIAQLESRVMELEQYTRMNDVIVTGLQVKPRSYARAVAADSGDMASEQETNSTEQQVVAVLQSKAIEMNSNDVEACHLLPRKNKNETPAIIIRSVNRKHKIAILKEGKKLKGTNVYINEHLTKHNADIAKKARYLRKIKKNSTHLENIH